jgi:hypothetical protein
MTGVALVALPALIGAAAGILGTSWKTRKDLEASYDIDLRKHRIDAYGELWRKLEPLAEYAPPAAVTYRAVAGMARDLRHWYFDAGGLFLSAETRAPYFNLQRALHETIKGGRDADRELDRRLVEILKALASRLRTATTDDVKTRLPPRLGERLRTPSKRAGPVSATVDRRWWWDGDTPVPAFFVIVKNDSPDVIEVEGAEIPGIATTPKRGQPPFLLQPREWREVALVPDEPVDDGLRLAATVRVKGRGDVTATRDPAPPLAAHVLER